MLLEGKLLAKCLSFDKPFPLNGPYSISEQAMCIALSVAVLTGDRGEEVQALIDHLHYYGTSLDHIRELVAYLAPGRSLKMGNESPRYIQSYVTFKDMVRLSKFNKQLAFEKLAHYVKKEWWGGLMGQIISNDSHYLDPCCGAGGTTIMRPRMYDGYWCLEAAAFVRIMGLDDQALKNTCYYPYDFAHYLGDPQRPCEHPEPTREDLEFFEMYQAKTLAENKKAYKKYSARKQRKGEEAIPEEDWLRRYGKV